MTSEPDHGRVSVAAEGAATVRCSGHAGTEDRRTFRVLPRPAARLGDGTEISAERARQIALCAGIHPMILGEEGLPLFLGRKHRNVSGAQRRALLALYETCCVKDCEIPAYLCEIHHLDGGWKWERRPISINSPRHADSIINGWRNTRTGSSNTSTAGAKR